MLLPGEDAIDAVAEMRRIHALGQLRDFFQLLLQALLVEGAPRRAVLTGDSGHYGVEQMIEGMSVSHAAKAGGRPV